MDDMKSQTENMMAIITHQDRTDHKEEQRLAREAQAIQNERTDARFEKLIQAFSQQASTSSPPSTKKTSTASKTKLNRKRNTEKSRTEKRATVAPTPSPLNQPLPMDTAPDQTNFTDPELRHR
jgi:hypothetical protein